MKITYEINSNDIEDNADRYRFSVIGDLSFALSDYDSSLRDILKYDNKATMGYLKGVEASRKLLYKCLREEGICLERFING